MSHLFESGLFVGTPAWHGLGVVLQNAPSVKEALTLAGLDWKVEQHPAFITVDGVNVPVPDCSVIVRNKGDVRTVFAHMGSRYHPLQNDEALARFQPLLDSGLATIEAAGSLDEGRKVWILAKIGGATADVIKGDTVQKYVLLAHSHDGTLRITFGTTMVRVVCNNTLQVALGEGDLIFRKHTRNAITDLDKLVASFGKLKDNFSASVEKFRHIATKKCDDKNMVRYAREILKPGSADTDEKIRHLDEVVQNFETGIAAQEPGVRGTLWGAYNAATEYLTHSAGNSQDTRQASNWFGPGAAKIDRALDVALAFAEHAPDAASLARECAANYASAGAEFSALLGKDTASSPGNDGSLFASLLDQPVAAE